MLVVYSGMMMSWWLLADVTWHLRSTAGCWGTSLRQPLTPTTRCSTIHNTTRIFQQKHNHAKQNGSLTCVTHLGADDVRNGVCAGTLTSVWARLLNKRRIVLWQKHVAYSVWREPRRTHTTWSEVRLPRDYLTTNFLWITSHDYTRRRIHARHPILFIFARRFYAKALEESSYNFTCNCSALCAGGISNILDSITWVSRWKLIAL